MQVFTLLGGYDYEGETLVGVFGSEQSVRKHVESKTWFYDSMCFVVSEIGEPVEGSDDGQPVSFTRYNGEIVGV
jgi:hypothetical protein